MYYVEKGYSGQEVKWNENCESNIIGTSGRGPHAASKEQSEVDNGVEQTDTKQERSGYSTIRGFAVHIGPYCPKPSYHRTKTYYGATDNDDNGNTP
jgi:hypothetical protein